MTDLKLPTLKLFSLFNTVFAVFYFYIIVWLVVQCTCMSFCEAQQTLSMTAHFWALFSTNVVLSLSIKLPRMALVKRT